MDDALCRACNGLGDDPRTERICGTCRGSGLNNASPLADSDAAADLAEYRAELASFSDEVPR